MQPHAPSWYAATAAPAPARPALADEVEADVCIVGGGFTGLSAALHCAEAGRSVVLLEAERIGWSASGRNGGQALIGLGCDATDMVRLLGEAHARNLWNLSVEAVRLQRELIARHAIGCDYRPGYLVAAPKPRHLDALAGEMELIGGRWGYGEARLVDAAEARALTGSARYAGGMLDAGSGRLHPLNYALGVARAAEAAGAQLCEGSRVTKVEADALHTAKGSVRAGSVVLACNAHVEEIAPDAAKAVLPVEATMIATAPLPAAAGVLPSGVAVSDANGLLDYYRLTPDRRLLFGARLGPSFSAREPRLVQRMLAVFPQLAGLRIDYRWSGWVALTRNRLPHFGRLGPRTFFAHGFSGHGVALTTLAGKLLAEAIDGEPGRFDEFARIPHRPVPFGRAARPALVKLAALGAALGDAF